MMKNSLSGALLLVQHCSYFAVMAIGRFRRSLRTGSYGWVEELLPPERPGQTCRLGNEGQSILLKFGTQSRYVDFCNMPKF